jgi:hypothetical protein
MPAATSNYLHKNNLKKHLDFGLFVHIFAPISLLGYVKDV